MKNDPGQALSVYDRLAKKEEVLGRIQVIKKELLPKVGEDRFNVDRTVKEIANEVLGLDPAFFVERIAELKARKASLIQRRDELDEEHKALTVELKSLEGVVLPGLLQETGAAEVREHQSKIAEKHAEAGQLQAAIEGQRKTIAAAEAAIVPLPDRGDERAMILADIAMGKAEQRDLDALDRQIAEERAPHEESRRQAEGIIGRARQTIGGLEGKLAAVKADIAALQRQSTGVMEQFLMTEIETVASRYVANALAVREDFLRLAALEGLLNKVVTRSPATQIIGRAITIPVPRVGECESMSMRNYPHLIFGTGPGITDQAIGYAAVEQAELARLRGEGCTLL